MGEPEVLARPRVSYWKDAWRRLKSNKIALVALIILLLLTFYGHFLDRRSVDMRLRRLIQMRSIRLRVESIGFGTDSLGRDIFARVWQAGRVSLLIGITGAVISSVVGCIYGGIAAYFGGIVDDIMMRIVEVLLSIPYFNYRYF